MIRRLLSLFALTCAAPAAAETTHDNQAWVNATLMGPVSGKVVYFAEVQPRFSERSGQLDMLLLRPAIGVKLSPTATLYQGYARVISPRDGAPDLKEHRSFQQLSWIVGKPWGGEASSRTRLEQRWRADGDDVGIRLREMARLEVPFRPGGKTAALVYAEAFFAFNDTDWGARSGFDQLRSFVGVEANIGGASTLEAGYLNQIVNQPAGRRRMNHVLSLTTFVRR